MFRLIETDCCGSIHSNQGKMGAANSSVYLDITSNHQVSVGDELVFHVYFRIDDAESANSADLAIVLPILSSGNPWSLDPSSSNIFHMDTPLSLSNAYNPVINTAYTATIRATAGEDDLNQRYIANCDIETTVGTVDYDNVSSASIEVVICLHGSAEVDTPMGRVKISEIKDNQRIIAADNNEINVLQSVKCWPGVDNKLFGTAIIFEEGSLSQGIPSSRLAVDAGHPVCSPEEYKENKNAALKPAKLYVNGENIYSVSWEQVKNLLPGENSRWDLILPDDSCRAYIANGVVIKSRKSRLNAGYDCE